MAKLAHNLVPQPTVHDAVNQVIHSGQQLIIDRIDLLRLDVQAEVDRISQTAALGAVAGLFGIAAFVALTTAASLFLATKMESYNALLIVGGTYALLATGAWFGGKALGKRGGKS